jgi:hypothetical protein
MVPGLRALLEGVLDYAGLFPPARLPLDEAVRNYLRYRREPESWMLARFVCPATRLAELGALLQDIGQGEAPVPLAVLGRGGDTVREFADGLSQDLWLIQEFRPQFGERAVVEVLEQRGPETWTPAPRQDVLALRGPLTICAKLVVPPPLFYETPFTLPDLAQLIRFTLGAGFKFRCGGVQPEAFPSPGDVAHVIVWCRAAGAPLKFTAGLHHPIRRFDPGLRVTMHGFVNVFGAAVLAHARGLDEEQLRPILEDEDAGNFGFDADGFRWKDYRAGTEEIATARRQVVSFGSCSFEEPRDDLRALGWLP